jgi:hypothetical protein
VGRICILLLAQVEYGLAWIHSGLNWKFISTQIFFCEQICIEIEFIFFIPSYLGFNLFCSKPSAIDPLLGTLKEALSVSFETCNSYYSCSNHVELKVNEILLQIDRSANNTLFITHSNTHVFIDWNHIKCGGSHAFQSIREWAIWEWVLKEYWNKCSICGNLTTPYSEHWF